MFGSTENRLDVHRFMREGKIVLINLAPGNRLSGQLANAIGALILNEVLATARSLPRGVRFPTYVVLDEFQNFVGPDIESALPEVRQLGLRLFLSHQSFSQLERGNYDMTSMIFQRSHVSFSASKARTRICSPTSSPRSSSIQSALKKSSTAVDSL